MAKADETVAQILKVFETRNDDGTYLYTDVEVRNFLPAVVFAAKLDVSQSPALGQLMTSFAEQIGFRQGMPDGELQKAIETHFRKNPVNDGLLRDFQRMCRELMLGGAEGDNAALAAMAQMAKSAEKAKGLAKPSGAGVGLRKKR